jgi:hypothetical protein
MCSEKLTAETAPAPVGSRLAKARRRAGVIGRCRPPACYPVIGKRKNGTFSGRIQIIFVILSKSAQQKRIKIADMESNASYFDANFLKFLKFYNLKLLIPVEQKFGS